MTDGNFPTDIYYVTYFHRPRVYGSIGALKLGLRRTYWSRRHGARVWKLGAPGWYEVTREFIDEEGYPQW